MAFSGVVLLAVVWTVNEAVLFLMNLASSTVLDSNLADAIIFEVCLFILAIRLLLLELLEFSSLTLAQLEKRVPTTLVAAIAVDSGEEEEDRLQGRRHQ